MAQLNFSEIALIFRADNRVNGWLEPQSLAQSWDKAQAGSSLKSLQPAWKESISLSWPKTICSSGKVFRLPNAVTAQPLPVLTAVWDKHCQWMCW